jgi:hypothetical protein
MNQTRSTIMTFIGVGNALMLFGITLLSFGHAEVYGQNTRAGSTFADSIECFVNPCDTSEVAASTPSTGSQNITALIGVAFNNLTLKEIQDNKENLTSSIIGYINASIDQLANGKAVTFTDCPKYPFIQGHCQITKGIIFPRSPTIRQ